MDNSTGRSRRIRIAAAICAVVVLTGGVAGMYALRTYSNTQAASDEKGPVTTSVPSADDDIISAGGTITSSQLTDSLGLEGTAVQLTVGEVLAESGETVTVGTPLYQITAESLTKAEKTLKSELKSAKNALLEQKMTYQTDKNEAYSLYNSELLLGDSAQLEYENSMASLDSELKKAKDSYQEALDTINDTPAKVSSKQAELDSQQEIADSLQSQKDSVQQELDTAKSVYDSAAEKYNAAVTEYNSAASVVRYLGNALGIDTSDIALAQTASPQKKTSAPTDSGAASKPEQGGQGFDPSQFEQSGSGMPLMAGFNSGAGSTASNDVASLYEKALGEYQSQKEKLSQAESSYKNAESEYDALSDKLNELDSELQTAQNSVTSLNKEISELNTSLSKAKSNLSTLRSEYNSLNASYASDQLELKNKLDTDIADYENAAYHYQITCATIEDELEEKQKAYDTAEKNLSIFNDDLSDGYIYAKQDGTVYSLNYQEGRSVNVSSPYVSYVDATAYTTVVELDQNDVTQVSIGDTVMIYSSESGIVNGKITAISAGTSTSLADVNFNVTVTAYDGAKLYNGESVNVYFNYGDMESSDLSDFTGGDDGEKKGFGGEGMPDFGGGMPDFSGGMPEGFDPSNMPDFRGRKGE